MKLTPYLIMIVIFNLLFQKSHATFFQPSVKQCFSTTKHKIHSFILNEKLKHLNNLKWHESPLYEKTDDKDAWVKYKWNPIKRRFKVIKL